MLQGARSLSDKLDRELSHVPVSRCFRKLHWVVGWKEKKEIELTIFVDKSFAS